MYDLTNPSLKNYFVSNHVRTHQAGEFFQNFSKIRFHGIQLKNTLKVDWNGIFAWAASRHLEAQTRLFTAYWELISD